MFALFPLVTTANTEVPIPDERIYAFNVVYKAKRQNGRTLLDPKKIFGDLDLDKFPNHITMRLRHKAKPLRMENVPAPIFAVVDLEQKMGSHTERLARLYIGYFGSHRDIALTRYYMVVKGPAVLVELPRKRTFVPYNYHILFEGRFVRPDSVLEAARANRMPLIKINNEDFYIVFPDDDDGGGDLDDASPNLPVCELLLTS